MTVSCVALAGCAAGTTNAAAPAAVPVSPGTSVGHASGGRAPAPRVAQTVGFGHWGSVTLGMTPSQAARKLGGKVATHGISGNDTCFQPRLAQPFDTVALMVWGAKWDGPIVRFDVGYSTRPGEKVVGRPRTDAGVGVGDSEAHVKAAYPGRVKVSAHTYVIGGHYLEILAGRGDPAGTAIVFESDVAGKVTSIRSGYREAAEAIEGCL